MSENNINETSEIPDLVSHLSEVKNVRKIGSGSSRTVYLLGELGLCVKVGHGSLIGMPERRKRIVKSMWKDSLMYEMSEMWGFGVVPFTKFIDSRSSEYECIEFIIESLDLDVVVREAFLLQRYVEMGEKDVSLDLAHAQKAIFFNLITGRGDQIKVNSVINPKGKIFEIDNEISFHGLRGADGHWIMTHSDFKKRPIESNLVEWVLGLPEEIQFEPNGMDPIEIIAIQNQVRSNVLQLKAAIDQVKGKRGEMSFREFMTAIDVLTRDERNRARKKR